ncbi:MAG TPA: hypothetical protein VF970_09700 [Gemmatimonadales bacterium]
MASDTAPPEIVKGTCYALFAYDVAPSIDLAAVERLTAAAEKHRVFQPRRRIPAYFEYRPAPLRLVREAAPQPVGNHRTEPTVETVLYDFGAVSVTFAFPLGGALTDLVALSDELYDNLVLRDAAQRSVEELLTGLRPPLAHARVADLMEEYVVFHIEDLTPGFEPSRLLAEQGQVIAQLLRSERRPLSEQEVADATSARVSVGRDDLTVIDWNTALLVGRVAEDVRAVLEFANVQLLELRYLDHLLDSTLERSYELLGRGRWSKLAVVRSYEADLRRVAQLQVDNTVLFERITNALKLLGEQSVSRTYRLVAERLYLEEWDASVTRKLKTADNLYHTLADWAATRRVELLEWIIIILIAVSIVIPFLGSGGAH